jgi:O-acetylhomoserine (thiol)-lyase
MPAQFLPIIQSTTFKYDSAEHVTKLFDLEAAGFFYPRLANPTSDGFERKIAQMEGGVGAMATSSPILIKRCTPASRSFI